MDTDNSRLQYLASQYLNDRCSPEELKEFWQHIAHSKDETELQEKLQHLWLLSKSGDQVPPLGWENTLQTIFSDAKRVAHKQDVITMRRRITKWVAAASVLLLLGGAGYFLILNKRATHQSPQPDVVVHDVKPPTSNRAMITMANGKRVYLDTAANGTLATEDNVRVVKLSDGNITYTGSTNRVVYNTLTNPRGSKVINITLSDNSHVWLDAESSITYPVAFVGKERKVSISGQAYFEVKHNDKMPFTVSANGVDVHDLGTAFNINAYQDESAVRVTLLNGAVNVSTPKASPSTYKTMDPGQQAVVDHNLISIRNGIDLKQVVAWKEGKFDFGDNMDLRSIMRQIARWYDMDIEYKDDVKQSFGGGISREVNISEVLKNFEFTGRVHFTIENKKIIVRK